MKKCTACGATFDDTSKFCPYCGTEYGAEEHPAEPAGEPGWQPEKPKKEKKIINTAQGMIWHKIVLFFVGMKAARRLLRGASILSYCTDKDTFSGLEQVRNLFLGMGIVNVAIGVFAMICLYRLGKRMRNGPDSVKILYGLCVAGALILSFWTSSIAPSFDLTKLDLFDGFLLDIVMLIVNSIYYSRRRDVFVN